MLGSKFVPQGKFESTRRGGRGRGDGHSNSRGTASRDRGTHTSWRGRGASADWTSQRGDFQNRHRKPAIEPLEAQAKGDLWDSVEVDEVKWSSRLDGKAPSVQNCEYVASYNLLHKKITTILVPGKSALKCLLASSPC